MPDEVKQSSSPSPNLPKSTTNEEEKIENDERIASDLSTHLQQNNHNLSVLFSLHEELGNALREFDVTDSLSDRAKHWASHLKSLKDWNNVPTVIAICGATGSGKSSLINAILDRQLVPTSGWQACTAVVTEISYHDSSDIFAEVAFLAKEEWATDLRQSLGDVQDLDEANLSGPNKASWDKIHAVYPTLPRNEVGKMTVQEILSRYEDVTATLGTVRTLTSTNPKEFTKLLSTYITGSQSRKRGARGAAAAPALWPLVRQVKIRCNATCLSTGATLVDLPGLADANVARGAIAKRYIQTCDFVWIVAPITRAKDDKVARELLDDTFKTQLLNGRLKPKSNTITFIATKCDDVDSPEIILNLGLAEDDRLIELDERLSEIAQIKAEQEVLLADADDILKQMTTAKDSRQHELTEKERDRRKLELSADQRSIKLKRKYMAQLDGPSPKKPHLDVIAAEHDQPQDFMPDSHPVDASTEENDSQILIDRSLEELDRLIKEHQDCIHNLEGLIKSQVQAVSQAKGAIAEGTNESRSIRRQKKAYCAQKRSEVAQSAIKNIFRVGIKELDGLIPASAREAARSDPNGFDPTQSESIRDYNAIDPPVFTCSSRDYLRLTNQVHDEEPVCFTDVADTDIPQLQEWIHIITKGDQRQNTKHMVDGTKILAQSIKTFCMDTGRDISNEQRTRLRMEWSSAYGELSSKPPRSFTNNSITGTAGVTALLYKEFTLSIKDTVTKLEDLFKNRLEAHARSGAREAARAAMDVHEAVVASGSWQAYKALIRRHGSFREVDLNARLAVPLAKSIARHWANLFTTYHFGRLELDALRAVESILQKISESAGSPKFKAAIDEQRRLSFEEAKIGIKHTLQIVQAHMTNEQKAMSREIAPRICKELEGSYERAASEKGKGSLNRQKVIMCDALSSKKENIFKDAVDVLMMRLRDTAVGVGEVLSSHFEGIAQKVEANCAVLWEPCLDHGPETTAAVSLEARKTLEDVAVSILQEVERLHSAATPKP